jgi:hypothetical protein
MDLAVHSPSFDFTDFRFIDEEKILRQSLGKKTSTSRNSSIFHFFTITFLTDNRIYWFDRFLFIRDCVQLDIAKQVFCSINLTLNIAHINNLQ